jgi:hypothetical protein
MRRPTCRLVSHRSSRGRLVHNPIMTKQPPPTTWPGGAGGDNPAITALRVVLAEDDVLLREGLASLLERSGVQVVGQAGDATLDSR